MTLAGVAGSFAWCNRELPPGAVPDDSSRTRIDPVPPPISTERPPPTLPLSDASVPPIFDASLGEDAHPYQGPWIGAISAQAPIFSGMEALRDKRIGYIRHGGKAPVDPIPIRSSNCEPGWYHLLAGGYICGKHATLDLNNPQVRLGINPPNVDDILPYRYGSNLSNGTPLYKSVPSREDMAEYEPYLKGKQAAADENPYLGDGGLEETKRPWWQTEPDGGKPDIHLSDLTEGADGLVAKRMFKGFYVAIDRDFPWNGRQWYKTTNALVAPADRLILAKPSPFHGMELGGTDPSRPVGFILSTRAHQYAVSGEGKSRRVEVSGNVDRFTVARLTGQAVTVGGSVYRETSDGWWMRTAEGTYTDPGSPPSGLQPGEKWIDVNLTRQTLVAFEGEQPVYATLVSSGRRARSPSDKLHDHQTVKGSFRIREKHIAITMDGDGPAPGDMPYSIEDVPYVEYFEGSYALHAAFWHSDFGHEHSHGCVNLAPLDAKRLFFWTDPPLPQGWHGVIAGRDDKELKGQGQPPLGTHVVVHD